MDLKSDTGVSCYLAVTPDERSNILNETFKGEVDDTQITFPKGLGAEHPFDFDQVDKILNNVGVADALVDKIVDAIVGDFKISIKDENANALLEDFAYDTKLKIKFRPWIKEAVSKGNGFMELDFTDLKNIEKLRVMKANNMYVKRNKKGVVKEYNYYKGELKTFSMNKKAIPFKPNQIAHLTINKLPNDPYGRGLVWSNRVSIENYAGDEVDKSKIISRKAGAPLHVKLGQPGQKVKKQDLDDFKSDLQYMNNSVEYVTDANVDMSIIDFAGIGDNITKAAEHDLEQLALGMKIPMSLVGVSNNPEGMAKTNDKEFLRFISSVRTIVEQTVESQILRPYLRSQGKLDGRVDFTWDLPGEDEKNERLQKIIDTLRVMDLSPELRASLEIEYAEILGLENLENVLPTPQEARKKADAEEAELKAQEDADRKAEEQIKQPEVPGAKKTANQSSDIDKNQLSPDRVQLKDSKAVLTKITECTHNKLTEGQLNAMTIGKYVNLKDIAGFNYSDYLVKILLNLRTEKFSDLLAITQKDLTEGLLPSRDINKLKIILKDGFRKNKTIKQIERDIKNSINLKDRVKIEEDGTKKLTLSASKRPISIARTETVRLANAGLKDMYIENDITTYRYLSAIDDRTSDICRELDGQVFLTKDGTPGVNMPPMHPMCRSSIVGLVN